MDKKILAVVIIIAACAAALWINRRDLRDRFTGRTVTVTESEPANPTSSTALPVTATINEKLQKSPALADQASARKIEAALELQNRFRASDDRMNRDALNALGQANVKRLLAVSQANTAEEQKKRLLEIQGMLKNPQFQKARAAVTKGIEARKKIAAEAKELIDPAALAKELEKVSDVKRIPVTNKGPVRKKGKTP